MNNAFLKKKPEKVDASVWEIVVEAWENGLSDNEAAFRVQKLLGVDLKAEDIRKWCKEYPDTVGELRACLLNDLLSDTKLVIVRLSVIREQGADQDCSLVRRAQGSRRVQHQAGCCLRGCCCRVVS